MSLRQMELVLKLAELKSFSKAAKALKISQPSLSQSIATLEKELGVKLFERATPLLPTSEGEIYTQKAAMIMQIYSDLKNELTPHKFNKKDSIKIGFSQNGYRMIPSVLPSFCKSFARAQIQVVQSFSTMKIKNMILNDELDLGMLILPINTDGLEFVSVAKSPVFLCLSSAHKLAKQRQRQIDLTLLGDEKFILPSKEQRSYAELEQLFLRAGFVPSVLCHTQSFDIATSMVASGVGACFSLREFIRADELDKIALFSLKDTLLEKELVIAYKKERPPSKLALEFIKMAKECGRMG